MNNENEKIFSDQISPSLDKAAWHVRPKRGEDLDDIRQELKACALRMIEWSEKRGDPLVTHPKAIVQRVIRYVISGRRAFSQRINDIMDARVGDETVCEYNDELGHSLTNPMEKITDNMDTLDLYKILGERNSMILDMMLCGHKQEDIARAVGMKPVEMSNLKRDIIAAAAKWAGVNPETDAKDQKIEFTDDELFGYKEAENTIKM